MKKADFIERYGEAAYRKWREQTRQWAEANPEKMAELQWQWKKANPEKVAEWHRWWDEAHPEEVTERKYNQSRKGGKYYEKNLKYQHTGLQGERNKIRRNHAKKWRGYKMIIAPDSQIHHSWILGASNYEGMALVEANQHMHGIIDVIEILDGEITVFTEKELREGVM